MKNVDATKLRRHGSGLSTSTYVVKKRRSAIVDSNAG